MRADVFPLPRDGGFAPRGIDLPDRFGTTRRFQGAPAARHHLSDGRLECGIGLWRRTPHGWVVGLTWSDGETFEARTSLCHTLEGAVRYVEEEGPAAGAAGRRRTGADVDPAEALVRPFLRRQAAVRLRRLYDELAGRALMDWQAGLGLSSGPSA